jgi:hypothetical protein
LEESGQPCRPCGLTFRNGLRVFERWGGGGGGGLSFSNNGSKTFPSSLGDLASLSSQIWHLSSGGGSFGGWLRLPCWAALFGVLMRWGMGVGERAVAIVCLAPPRPHTATHAMRRSRAVERDAATTPFAAPDHSPQRRGRPRRNLSVDVLSFQRLSGCRPHDSHPCIDSKSLIPFDIGRS